MDFEGPQLGINGTKLTSTCNSGTSVVYFEVGTANIENVTIESETLGGVYASGAASLNRNCSCNVKNSTIEVKKIRKDKTYLSAALAVSNGSTMNVEGTDCSVVGAKAAAYVFSSGGTINLKSGTYKGNESCLIVDRSTSQLTENTVESWIYYSNNCSFEGNNSINISDGFKGGIQIKTF